MAEHDDTRPDKGQGVRDGDGRGAGGSNGSDSGRAPGIVQRAMACASFEEFKVFAEENGLWVNDEAARSAWSSLHREGDDELELDELDGVAGGGCGGGGSGRFNPSVPVRPTGISEEEWRKSHPWETRP